MRAALDAAMMVTVCGVSGGAGWWCHAAVEERRTRLMLARIHERLTHNGSGALDG